MLNFFKGLWGFFSNPIEAIWHEILNLFAAVYSFFDRLYNALASDITGVARSLAHFADSVAKWVTTTVNWIIGFIKSEANAIVKWASQIIDDVRTFAIDAYKWTVQQIDRILGYIASTVNSIVSWIIKNIWNPLYTNIAGAINWITRYGNWIFDLVSNPEKLVAWIFGYLVRAWLQILKTWGVPIVAFILQQARFLIPDVVALLEDVISKVL